MDLPFPSLGRRWLWISKKQIHVVNGFADLLTSNLDLIQFYFE